ncbi:hypothetical protein [Microcoleus sp. FACHB-672]|uniref:hypothetical protein n=1 Tax=Microcoleus sp. FACHB-672 TaxID=2692825 RepID=UPI001686F2B1|nr:hypothetical protein [Microcoleus sp. FACHB-672]MBD2042324.1 hypothetical protein [Microcoleus sp. FACHB-672]
MIESARDFAVAAATALLTHYSFDLGGYTAEQLIERWLGDYQAHWLRLALIEALYQGRYKAISVAQILALWRRRGQPIFHFNHEFERLVCRKFPNTLSSQLDFYPELSSVSAATISAAGFSGEGEENELEVTGEEEANPSETPALMPGEAVSRPNEAQTRGSTFPQTDVVGDAEAILEFTDNAALTEPRYYQAEQSKPVGSNPNAAVPAETEKTAEQLLQATWPVKFQPLPAKGEPPVPSEQAKALDTPQEESVEVANIEDEAGLSPKSETSSQGKYQADWSRCDTSKQPIVQFSPSPESSEFYTKLKAVAHPPEDAGVEPSVGKPQIRDIEVERDLWEDD